MERFLLRAVTGLHMVAFGVFCLVASPVILFSFGVSAVRDGIESRWPGSERARAVSFWLELLAPFLLMTVLVVVLLYAIGRVRELQPQPKM